MSFSIRVAQTDDAPVLAGLARATFVETFVEGFRVPYPAADLDAFLTTAYAVERVASSLASNATRWWIAERGGVATGYASAGPCGLPHLEAREHHGELKRLYVQRADQGTGVGRALLDASLAWLEQAFAGPLWLGVWSGNEKAQRLYQRHGFVKVGEYAFPVGRTRDREFIFCRPRL